MTVYTVLVHSIVQVICKTSLVCEIFILGPVEPTLPYAGSELLPPGLTVINDFISAEEEQQLLAALDWTNAEIG